MPGLSPARVFVRSDSGLSVRNTRRHPNHFLFRNRGRDMSLEPEDNSRLGVALGIAAVFILFFLLFAWFLEWV